MNISNKKFKLSNFIAQSSVEYILMLLLVVAAIIIMKPFVIRSWNAQQKGWDDSIKDSLRDPRTKATFDFSQCGSCDTISACVFPPCCGSGTWGTCPATSEAFEYKCPQNTDPSKCTEIGKITCQSSPLCCTTPVPDSSDNIPCPEGGIRSSFYCGDDPAKHFKCVAKSDNITCRQGDWTPWMPGNPPNGWLTVRIPAENTVIKARFRQCVETTGDGQNTICEDCLCEENLYEGVTNTLKLTTTDPDAVPED